MRKVILAGVSTLALALGGCSTFDNMFHSGSSDQSTMNAQSQKPAQAVTNSTAPGAGAGGQTATPAMTATVTRDQVKMAQRKLRADGFYKAKIDGIAGPKTRRALSRYQQQQGLAQTGTLDRKTLAQLTGAEAAGVGSTVPPAAGQSSAPAQPGSTPQK